MNKFFSLIFIIVLPVTIFLYAFQIVAFNENNFKENYIKHDVSSITHLNLNELMKITREILSNLKGSNNQSYLKKYFNEKEMLHLEDVRRLFQIGFNIKYISLTLLLVSTVYLLIKSPNTIRMIINYSVLIVFIIFGVLILLISVDFNKYFTYFHVLLFNNELWLLNPNTDLMIQMMPEPLFINLFVKIILLFFSLMSIIVMVVNIKKMRVNIKNEN